MFEQGAHGAAQVRGVVKGDPSRSFQAPAHRRIGKAENQIVGPEAGDVELRVEPLQGVVEVAGQKHPPEPAPPEHVLFPGLRGHEALRRLVDRLPVVRRDPVPVEAEQRLGHLHQPTVLHRVLHRPQMGDQPRRLFSGSDIGVLDLLSGHAGGMGQLRVVVIPQDVGQRLGSGPVRVDVGVRVDEPHRIQLLKDPVSQFQGHDLSTRPGRFSDLLVRGR